MKRLAPNQTPNEYAIEIISELNELYTKWDTERTLKAIFLPESELEEFDQTYMDARNELVFSFEYDFMKRKHHVMINGKVKEIRIWYVNFETFTIEYYVGQYGKKSYRSDLREIEFIN